MKNRMIREAWDTVNPTQQQKERMRAALEAHLEASGKSAKRTEKGKPRPQEEQVRFDFTLPEDPYAAKHQEKQVKAGKKERRYYSSKQAKTNWPIQIAAIAAVLMVTAAGGLFLGWMSGQNRGTPSYAAPDFTETTSATKPTEPETAGEYKTILEKYETALAEHWDGSRCASEEISILVRDVQSAGDLGYALMDLNGDGSEELLITDGNVIYDMYAVAQGEVLHPLTSWERMVYYLCGDNVIAYVGSSSTAKTEYQFFTYVESATMRHVASVTLDVSENPDNPWSNGLSWITEQEAKDIIDTYPHITIPFTPFPDKKTENEVPQGEALMELYAKSIPEALKNYEKSEEKTFCFYDCDGDGQDELLLGAGESVYRVLQPVTGAGGVIDISLGAGNSMEYVYMCEDHVFELEAYGQGNWHHQYFTLDVTDDGMKNTEIVDYVFHNEENESWYLGGTGINTPIPDEDAEAIRNSHPRMKLDWKPLSQFPVAIEESSESSTTAGGNTDLFEKGFMAVAEAKTGASIDEISKLLEDNGFQPSHAQEDLIEWEDPQAPGSYIMGVFDSADGKLTEWRYTRVFGDFEKRAMMVKTTAGWTCYMSLNIEYVGMSAETPEGFREFITEDTSVTLLEIQARAFAYAYFKGNEAYLRENMTSDVSDVRVYDGDGWNAYVGMVKGVDAGAAVRGRITVSVECKVPPESDSYTYLTMELVSQNGVWRVSSYSLEK